MICQKPHTSERDNVMFTLSFHNFHILLYISYLLQLAIHKLSLGTKNPVYTINKHFVFLNKIENTLSYRYSMLILNQDKNRNYL